MGVDNKDMGLVAIICPIHDSAQSSHFAEGSVVTSLKSEQAGRACCFVEELAAGCDHSVLKNCQVYCSEAGFGEP